MRNIEFSNLDSGIIFLSLNNKDNDKLCTNFNMSVWTTEDLIEKGVSFSFTCANKNYLVECERPQNKNGWYFCIVNNTTRCSFAQVSPYEYVGMWTEDGYDWLFVICAYG